MEFGDAGGSFSANAFGDSAVFEALNPAAEGGIVRLSGKTDDYNDMFSPKLQAAEVIEGAEAEAEGVLSQLVEVPPESEEELWADLTERLEHIILSHQGELGRGAATMAATPEAVFVSMIDNLDAKMGMVQRVLRNASEGEEFSERLLGLQTRVLLTPPDKS